MATSTQDGTAAYALEGGTMRVTFSGRWALGGRATAFADIREAIDAAMKRSEPPQRLVLEARELGEWDTSLLNYVAKLDALATTYDLTAECGELPEGLVSLLGMSRATPEKDTGETVNRTSSVLEVIGRRGVRFASEFQEAIVFIGDGALCAWAFVRGRSHTRWQDIWLLIQKTGAEALGIVTLISLLVGLILSFVGAQILKAYGGEIFVADLVGISMTREMGAMMTAIIMCGRTGAAFAAELGSMKTNEEIDALNTLGISPGEFLILPRVLALVLMMPLLTIYADFVGILGGLVVAIGLLDVTFTEYILRTHNVVSLTNFFIGVAKGFVFGFLVAVSGCLRGMQCGGSSSAVGDAATSAVVTGITLVIIADAVFAVVLSALEL